MNKKAILFFILSTVCMFSMLAQQTGTEQSGYRVFYSPDSVIVSEGLLRDGKPDGYWKNYYTDGTIKSEGNRINFLLDSIW